MGMVPYMHPAVNALIVQGGDMEFSFNIGWDFPSSWTKYGRLRKAWWFHPWFGVDSAVFQRFTTGFRVLGFHISIDFTY